MDPKPNSSISEYSCFNNNPIWFSDLLGDTIKIEGSKRFIRRIEKQFSKLIQTEEGKGLYIELHGSDQVFTVKSDKKRPDGVKGNAYGNNVLYFGFSKHGGTDVRGKTRRPSFVAFGREMKHALDDLDGLLDIYRSQKPVKTDDGFLVNYQEFSAVNTENIIRAQANLPLRKYYAKQTTNYYDENGVKVGYSIKPKGLMLKNNKSSVAAFATIDYSTIEGEKIRRKKMKEYKEFKSEF